MKNCLSTNSGSKYVSQQTVETVWVSFFLLASHLWHIPLTSIPIKAEGNWNLLSQLPLQLWRGLVICSWSLRCREEVEWLKQKWFFLSSAVRCVKSRPVPFLHVEIPRDDVRLWVTTGILKTGEKAQFQKCWQIPSYKVFDTWLKITFYCLNSFVLWAFCLPQRVS